MIWSRWRSASFGRIGREEPTQSLVWKCFGLALASHRVCWSSSPTTDSKDDRNGCRPEVGEAAFEQVEGMAFGAVANVLRAVTQRRPALFAG